MLLLATCNEGFATEDTGYLISMAIVVLSMQGGFALLEAGGVRHTSSVNIMSKNIGDLCVGALCWWAVGYALAFGDGDKFIGWDEFFGNVSNPVMWFFQMSFASTTSTIDSGAVAERFSFIPYLFLSAFMTAWTYPVVVHWVWSGQGFLSEWGFVDFAGSGVVHLVGACSGLVGTMWIGPRLGRFPKRGEMGLNGRRYSVERDGADAVLTDTSGQTFAAFDPLQQMFGTFLLWLGWFAFNAGSTLALSGGGDVLASHIVMTTSLGGAAGGVGGAIISYYATGLISVENVSNGILTGLVAITANCHLIETWEAVLIGTLASILVFYSNRFIASLGIDDPVSAVSIHGVGGIFGLLATGLFANPTKCGADPLDLGVFYDGGSWHLLGVQALGALIIAAWSIVNTLVFLAFMQYVLKVRLRVTPEEERAGLDLTEHGVDQGEKVLAFMRNLHHTLATLSPEERALVRSVMSAFMMSHVKSVDGPGAAMSKRSLLSHGGHRGMVGSDSLGSLHALHNAAKTSVPVAAMEEPAEAMFRMALADELLMAEKQDEAVLAQSDRAGRRATRESLREALRESLAGAVDLDSMLDKHRRQADVVRAKRASGTILRLQRKHESTHNITHIVEDDELIAQSMSNMNLAAAAGSTNGPNGTGIHSGGNNHDDGIELAGTAGRSSHGLSERRQARAEEMALPNMVADEVE